MAERSPAVEVSDEKLLSAASTVAERLEVLGVGIPGAPSAVASYSPAKISGNYVYVSGQLPFVGGELLCTGQVDAKKQSEATEAARRCAINALGAMQSLLGDLERVLSVVKIVGFVSSKADFTAQPQVINGASDFIVQVFGERGKHARSAVGVASLPLGASVEVELIAEFD